MSKFSRVAILVAVVFSACIVILPNAVRAQSVGFDWGSQDFFADDGNPDLVDPLGTTLGTGNTWLIQLYLTTDGAMQPFAVGTDDVPATHSANSAPIVTSVASEGVADRFHAPLSDSFEGSTVFTVIVNADDIATASKWAIVDDAPYDVPADGHIDAGSISVFDWQDAICPVGQFWGDSGCALCDASCAACTGTSASECTLCDTGSVLVANACLPLGEGCIGRDASNCLSCVANAAPVGLACSCLEGHYDADAGIGFGALDCRACAPVEACASTVSCSNASDSQCQACDSGYYLEDGTADVCTACGSCGSNEYLVGACTATADATCGACDSKCDGCTANTAADCSSCATGHWDDSGVCRACTICSAGSFISAACTATANTGCTTCSTCETGTEVSSACTDTADTVCSPIAGPADEQTAGTVDGGCASLDASGSTYGTGLLLSLLALRSWRRRRR